jgi:hypothetical protein
MQNILMLDNCFDFFELKLLLNKQLIFILNKLQLNIIAAIMLDNLYSDGFVLPMLFN